MREKRVIINKAEGALPLCLILLLLIVSACGEIDIPRLVTNQYYVAHDSVCDVVLCFEDVSPKSISGRWYVEEGWMAEKHSFDLKPHGLHRRGMRSGSLRINTDSQTEGDTLVLDLKLDGTWRTMYFQLWKQPPLMDIEKDYPYHDRIYDVKCDTNVVYAHAKGYWVSYPELDRGANEPLQIVLAKMTKDDLTKKDWDLKMDVYMPITNDTARRPLLLLIHGGAFFNGDKASVGYPEWGNYFASLGYVVASINYRIGFVPLGQDYVDRAGYRAVQDAHAAICYLLRHPDTYPINPDLLFVGGSSAGGITALNLAFMEDRNRPDCTKEGFVHIVSQGFNEMAEQVDNFFDNFFDRPERERKTVGMDDLGDINAVAVQSGGDVKFKINTVVNMWGAVHDISMLGNSKSTAVLSFHGDADSIVAYGYGYPFANVKTPVRDFIEKVSNALEASGSDYFQEASEVLSSLGKRIKPINEILCGKMYGSKCIDEKAKEFREQGMVSELHTKAGGGHSLHDDGIGVLTDYYTLITDTTTRFLYLRMFPNPSLKIERERKGRWFVLENAGELKTCRWEATGGLVLEAEPDRARVIFFDDAYDHKIRIVGQKKDGAGYSYEEIYK